jgi:hypothetical protein
MPVLGMCSSAFVGVHVCYISFVASQKGLCVVLVLLTGFFFEDFSECQPWGSVLLRADCM